MCLAWQQSRESYVMLVVEFSFLQRIQAGNAICSVLPILIGVEIKMIESLQMDTSLYWYVTNLMVFEKGTCSCTLIL